MNQSAANAKANAISAYVIWVEFDIHTEHLAQFTSVVRINAIWLANGLSTRTASPALEKSASHCSSTKLKLTTSW